MKKKVMIICIIGLCCIVSATQISITATSRVTGEGYIEGQSYTFITDIGNSFSGDFRGYDDGFWINYWHVGTASSAPALLSGAGGSMVTGDYVSADEQMLATIGTDWLRITIGMPANLQTPNGSTIYGMAPKEVAILIDGISFAPLTSFVNPAAYFAAYAGTYNAVGEYVVDNTADSSASELVFDTTSVTITPEPATMAILGLGGLFIRRRRKA